jgi:hypothetical protein
MSLHGSVPRWMRGAVEPHVCRVCRQPFVIPLSIVPLRTYDGFVVELRCNNCEDSTVALLRQDALERLDRELDRQTGRIRHELAELHLADELERVDRFVAALHAGHVLPEDF